MTMRLEMELERPAVSGEEIEALLGRIIPDGVEVVVTDPGCLRVLNRRFRRIDRATDVLSFDLSDEPGDRPEGTVYVDGRLAPPVSELLERILHGYLHLCGMNHDTEEAAAEMSRKLAGMLDTLGGGSVQQ